ncbi:flavodoxin domain-containing protein [Xanthomonas euroxanthea]
MLASVGMSVFFVTGWMLYLDRRRKKRALRAAREVLHGAPAASQAEPWLIGFASQSGFAERLAWQAAGHLQAAGLPVQVRSLAQLGAQHLQGTRHALFVVSTFGDGEPPDTARSFERELLRQRMTLSQLTYAVLALGDRQYAQFCGFSRRIEQWLQAQGAQPLFPAVEMDNTDPQALAQWHAQLAQIAGAPVAAVPLARPALLQWTLSTRTHLNPGSEGAPIWQIDLLPPSGTQWQAGDILEVQPAHAYTHVRACLAAWGCRQTRWCMWMRSCCRCSRPLPSACCRSRPRARQRRIRIHRPGWMPAPGCRPATTRWPACRPTAWRARWCA